MNTPPPLRTMITEIRDPIHGFIVLENEWEKDIVNHECFQRLRWIHQLGLTSMVYPGAVHSRFEHSLGVMHIASQMFDEIVSRRKEFLKAEMSYDESGIQRDRALIRITALLHDIGHAPFSHAAEELMPINKKTKKPYSHEQYSCAIIDKLMRDIIDKHKFNERNYHITANEVIGLLSDSTSLNEQMLFWKELISGHIDADRADYFLRDSFYAGVEYGKYDLARLLKTITIGMDTEINSHKVAIGYDGLHVAEAFLIARYMMFTQVYFHKTRRIYDHHLQETMKYLLRQRYKDKKTHCFPPPINKNNVKEYIKWTDCYVLGCINENNAGEHGKIIKQRKHYKCIYETPETPTQAEMEKAQRLFSKITHPAVFDESSKAFYKLDSAEYSVLISDSGEEHLEDFSRHSKIAQCLKTINQIRIYQPKENNT